MVPAASTLPEMAAAIQSTTNDNPELDGDVVARANYFYALVGRKDEAIRMGKRACEMFPINKNAVDGVRHAQFLAKA